MTRCLAPCASQDVYAMLLDVSEVVAARRQVTNERRAEAALAKREGAAQP